MSDRVVRALPHDPAWEAAYANEAEAIGGALGETIVAIHHIGSTAILGILAKPIIDILAEVRDLGEVDARAPAMMALGYQAMGEFGIAGRRYFRRSGADGARTHHVHMFEAQTPHVERHLAFRDYLRADRETARTYSDLKASLTGPDGISQEDYVAGKAAFVERTQKQALAWYRSKT